MGAVPVIREPSDQSERGDRMSAVRPGKPIEPEHTGWVFPNPPETDAEGFVAHGADVLPGTLLMAFRTGLFPLPITPPPESVMGWFSPDPRAILPIVPSRRRTVRRARRKFVIRTDTAFLDVVDGCADPRRPHGWISPELRTTYGRLHELGWAHSVEAWLVDGHADGPEERLAGGLFGVSIGGFFSAESMFHSESDGSKAAVAGLVEIVAAAGDSDTRLIDVQMMTAHLASLGAIAIPRRDYLRRLARAMTLGDAFAAVPPSGSAR